MQIQFGILKKNDTVLNVWENHIAVKKKTGDVEIFEFYTDDMGMPRLGEHSILITQGDGTITTKAANSSVEITTF